jgi:hypothetical protein
MGRHEALTVHPDGTRAKNHHQLLGKLQAQFGERDYALRALRFWIGEVRRGRDDFHDQRRARRSAGDCIDIVILSVNGKFLFESARSIEQMLKISQNRVSHELHEILGFKSFPLR